MTTLIRALGLAAIFLGLTGCYVVKQGAALLDYNQKAVPLEGLFDSPDTDPATRKFIERVKRIKLFAVRELGLEENDNYTRYVELDRDYLAHVVSATAKDAFRRHEWWFPLVGDVPYKGFFREEDAREEAEKLREKDLDVWVRRVDAFSTLGYFSDPLYSYMKKYSDRRLADLLIHEQTHATVYISGRSQFNEELAGLVGREGARLYMEREYGKDSPEIRTFEDGEADAEAFSIWIKKMIAGLDALYAKPLPREEKLAEKEKLIQAYKKSFAAEYSALFRTDSYRWFLRVPVNNAFLSLYQLYDENSAAYRSLYERSGRDLRAIIEAAKTLKKKKGDPLRLLEESLGLK